MGLVKAHFCRKFDQFLRRLKYVAKYIEYKRKQNLENPRIVIVKTFLCFTWMAKTRVTPTKQVNIQYGRVQYGHSGTTDVNPFFDFGGLAIIVGSESSTGFGSSGFSDSGGGFNFGDCEMDSGGGCDSGGGGCDSGGGGCGGGSCD